MKVEQFEGSVPVLDQGGAGLHPVAAVEVFEAVDASHLGAVDVAADDPIDAGGRGEPDHAFLELGHVSDRGLGLVLEVGRDRPVAEAEASSEPVEVEIEVEDALVESGAHPFEEPVEMDESVQLVAVQDEEASSVGRGVDDAFRQADAPEGESGEALEELVVVSVEVRDPGLLAVLTEDLLDDGVGVGVPVPAALELPSIDDVAHKVEVAALGGAKELEKDVGLGMAASQVDVGDPDRPELHGRNQSGPKCRIP